MSTVQIFPFETVEAMLGETLASLYASVDALTPKNLKATKSLTKLQSIRATASLWYLETRTALDLLEPYHDASLNPKHRDLRTLLSIVTREIEGSKIAEAKSTKSKEAVKLARLFSSTLEAYHRLLHPDTTQDTRQGVIESLLESYGRTTPTPKDETGILGVA